MKYFFQMLPIVALVVATQALAAEDPSIDRLLNKLPPPEKFVDAAVQDPLNKQMAAAIKAHNFGVALDASRRLSGKYPKSVGAQMAHGILAQDLRLFPEASAAYRKALSIRPDFATAYVAMALNDASRQNFRACLADFQQVTRLAPKSEVGWTGSSMCFEKLGRRKESLEYARHATAVAPSSFGAWYQLGREESLRGDKQASASAFARAKTLMRKAPQRRR